jgi:protein gp37
MGALTKIEWCDHTFNPWIGCTRLSPACDHCYAAELARRYGWATWGAGEPRYRTSVLNWHQPNRWNAQAAREGVRRRVFCASLADVFDAEIDPAWRGDLMALVEATPALDWLMLTKRPKVAAEFFDGRGVPDNVWMGTTVENQKMADLRIPTLLSINSRVRFLSCEPLLGPLDLRAVRWGHATALTGLHWIIAGGESGSKARPSHPDWIRLLRDQCADARIPFFFKQWGDWHADALLFKEASGPGSSCPPPSMKIGKKKAGSLLDGREHREFPS